MRKKIIIVSGDPNSINSEIIFKNWKKFSSRLKKKIYFISNYKLLKVQFRKLKYNIKIKLVNNIYEAENDNDIKIINIDLKFKDPFKVSKKDASLFVLNSLNLAHKLALNKGVSGIINCPISKILLNKGKFGVTELLASKCNIKNNCEAMLIRNKKLSVCPISTHIDIKDVSKKIKSSLIINKVKTIDNWFNKLFKRKPAIGVLGLNPHNAELRANSEEKKIILPALLKMRKMKINVKGPLIADTIFIQDYKNYAVIVGMYHDQVLAPFKSLFKFNAINITLGLKYLRVSPDHGVANNIIGKNKANPTSLFECVKYIDKYVK